MKAAKVKKSLPTEVIQARSLRVLLVEDSVHDAELMVRYLESSGYNVHHQRVYNAATMEEALKKDWDLVLCDYMLPSFDVAPAIDLLKRKKLDLPFIVVSGTVGEKVAVDVMKAGAHDFIPKENLTRLAPAIDRELREAQVRAQRAADMEKLFYLAAIVDSTGEAIFSQNMDGILTTWNAGARKTFRIYGSGSRRAVHHHDYPRVLETRHVGNL